LVEVAALGRLARSWLPWSLLLKNGEFELVPGQIGRELASGLVPEPPAGPVYGTADDASVGLNLVESGELTLRLEAAVTVTRTTGPEEVAAGTEFTLGPGESFIWPPNVAGELRNDGPEPAVQLLPVANAADTTRGPGVFPALGLLPALRSFATGSGNAPAC
jgi:hypothetical protein